MAPHGTNMGDMPTPATATTPADATPQLRLVGDGRRRQNPVLAAQRRTRAIQLVGAGQTYQQVADELGYKNRGTVYKIVHRALQAEQSQSVEMLRRLQVDRLDAMLSAVWDAASAGDLEAVAQASKIIMAECRLQGLIETGKNQRVKCQQPQTVVRLQNDCRDRECPDHT